MKSRLTVISIHLLTWLALLLIPLLFIDAGQARWRFFAMSWFGQLLMASYFYYNYLFLIPRFLLKRRLLPYVLLLLAGLIVICLANVGYVKATWDMMGWKFPFRFWKHLFFPLYPSFLAWGISTAIRITNEWFRNERRKKELEAENLQSELAFLKSQINPHFLFNTLNNICSLARKKSDETENAIITLSGIMRYMLEYSGDEKVVLTKEVEYLQSYIELQRLRVPETMTIQFTVEGNTDSIMIEPMLLIPFVENAFKHGIRLEYPSSIGINLRADSHSLNFSVTNPVSPFPADTEAGSGIGLKNVARRLELLYPDQHSLTIRGDQNHYEAILNLKFKS